MDSKKNKPGGMTEQHIMTPGFYRDELKSLQAVPCGSGNVPNYMKESFNREQDFARPWNEPTSDPRMKSRAQEMFQGEYTYPMGRWFKDRE